MSLHTPTGSEPPAELVELLRRARLAIVATLEALEAGDQWLAVEILLSVSEDGPVTRPYPCRNGCGAAHEWPGTRDAHEQFCTTMYGREEVSRAAA